MTPFRLQYVFQCKFRDGTRIWQTPEDVSMVDPLRSAFYDVEQRGVSEVEYFAITNGRETYGVDLNTGVFTVNGLSMWVGEDVPYGTSFKLWYYRLRKEHFNVVMEHLGSECFYQIGWTAQVNGETVKSIISLPHTTPK